MLYLWIPSTKEVIERESEKILKGNKYVVLAMENEEPGFTRQAKRP